MLEKYKNLLMLSNRHILITGSNGFVGRHLSAAILKTGAKLTQLVRTSEPSSNRESVQIAVDLRNRNRVTEIFSALQPDYVIHLASEKNRNDICVQFRDSYDRNLSISLNVIEACLALPKFQRLVFLGSCDEYGHKSSPFDEMQRETPLNSYGLSKLTTTKILLGLYQSCQFPSIVLRPTVIYGPSQGDEMFLSALIQSLMVQKDFAMTYGEQYRDFVYIDDVVDAIIKSLTEHSKLNGTVVNIGAGFSWQVKNIATLVANSIHPDANNHLKFGVVPYRPTEVMKYAVNIARAEKLLGWQPTTKLEKGLQQTVNYFRAQVDAPKTAIAFDD
jgi:nucleoside-diphosphate-sugar epimerase